MNRGRGVEGRRRENWKARGTHWRHVMKTVEVFLGKLVGGQKCVCARGIVPTKRTEVFSCTQDKSSGSLLCRDKTPQGGDCPGPSLQTQSALACASRSCLPGPAQQPVLFPFQPQLPRPCSGADNPDGLL